MAWRFRKRVKLIPGVYLNLSKNGISTTIGSRGLSVNIGPKGSFLNTSIPGSGLYNRIPLNKSNHDADPGKTNEIEGNLDHMLHQYYDGSMEIKSGSLGQLTTAGLKDLKATIIAAHHEYDEIERILQLKINARDITNKRLTKTKKSLFKSLFKKRIERLSFELHELEDEVSELNEQLQLSSVELQVQHDDAFELLYSSVEKAYQLIVNCSKIWDITTSKMIDKVQQRSFASTEVNRVEVRSFIQHSGLIVTKKTPLKLLNKNGGDLYFYPGFVIIHEQSLDFAILDYSELDLDFIDTQFVESDIVPADSEVIGKTWAKVNKDGSRDKRFAGNYQIPIARYGRINFKSSTGVNESYLFSNSKHSKFFFLALKEYIGAIKTASNLIKQFN